MDDRRYLLNEYHVPRIRDALNTYLYNSSPSVSFLPMQLSLLCLLLRERNNYSCNRVLGLRRYSRPKRYFLRKGLTRRSWEVMTQKATTNRATARAAVVSRMKLGRWVRKNSPTIGSFGRKK